MINQKLLGLILIICIVVIIIFPFENFLERYQTVDESLKSVNVKPAVIKYIDINNCFVVSIKEENIFDFYYIYKDKNGWKKPDKDSTLPYNGKLDGAVAVRPFVNLFGEVIVDKVYHKISNTNGSELEMFEINDSRGKLFIWVLVKSHKPKEIYTDVMIDGIPCNLSNIRDNDLYEKIKKVAKQ